MSDDILDEFGRDSGAPQKPRATNGGKQDARNNLAYSKPWGPTDQMQNSAGLHGDNHGPMGTQGKR